MRHRQLLRLRRHHPDPPVRPPSSAWTTAAALSQGRAPRQGPGREPRPHGGQRRGGVGRPAPPTSCRSCAARSPTRTSSPRPRPAGPTTCARASRATRCAGDGGRATTGSRASSTRRSGARTSGVATGSTAADPPRAVLVVGGGPGGLEAARVAAERGHEVTLVEADRPPRRRVPARRPAAAARPDPRPAGLVRTPARPARRRRAARRLASTPTQVAGDRRRPGRRRHRIATGEAPASSVGRPAQDALPGVDASNVLAVEDVLSGGADVGRRVVVLDDTGDWRGGGTAWHLAELGHDVVVVTGHPIVGATSSARPATARCAPVSPRSACRGTPRPW